MVDKQMQPNYLVAKCLLVIELISIVNKHEWPGGDQTYKLPFNGPCG